MILSVLAALPVTGAEIGGFVRPSDPDFDGQWALENRGQPAGSASEKGTPDADLDGVEAFAAGYTGQGVVIALVGQGFEYRGSDVEAALWQNPGEIPANRIDDDRNGFVDDVVGYDFAEHDPEQLRKELLQVAAVAVAWIEAIDRREP